MNWIEAFLLGIVQGLTEFFPVSSSGHLVMIENLMNIHQQGIIFELSVHAATLIAVLIFYRKRIIELTIGIFKFDYESILYGLKLGLATVPAVLLVLLAGDILEKQFESPVTAGLCLLITGFLLWTTRYTLPKAKNIDISWISALLIGCAQAFAILPGISRSGTTVVIALALGINAIKAAEFSFLMSVIAILGAIVFKIPEIINISGDSLTTMAIGAVAALASGLLALSLFVRFLRAQSFHRFAYYVWVIGLAFLCWLI